MCLAFELLVKSVDTHFDTSRAWLRIAEACIAHYCSASETRENCIISEIGEGEYQTDLYFKCLVLRLRAIGNCRNTS